MYARTSGDLLLNDGSSENGPVYWMGLDSGGGAFPIGPNGPWECGRGPAVVTRATGLITGPLTSAPFRLVDPSRLDRDLDEPRWVTDPMLTRPDDRSFGSPYPAVNRLARSVFWADWVRSAIWWGEGHLLAAVSPTGQPVAGSLRLLNPRLMDTERDEGGALHWQIADDGNGSDPVTFDRQGFLRLGAVTYRLITLRNPHSPIDENGRSMGVFAMNPAAFRVGHQIQEYTGGTFRSGIPAGYLKVNQPDLKQGTADKLKASWLANHGGDRRSIAVLNATTDFVPINLSPVDAELEKVQRLNIADVAFAFGLDPQTLGVSLANALTYTNTRDAWEQHRSFGLSPWIASLQDTLSALVPAGQEIRVDLDGFARPSRQERYTAYKTAIDAGILTVDEIRALEDLPPMPESEKPQTPPQLLPFAAPQPENEQEQETA